MMSRKILAKATFILLGVLLLSSCGRDNSGELLGVQDRPSWSGINPYGMAYIPSGTLHVGQSDQDIFNNYSQRTKSISISGFFMDETEITNNEYREFVYWVRDSLALTELGYTIEDDFGNEMLDWESEVDYLDETLDDMYHQGDMAFDGKRELDTEKFNYKYNWIDWKKAASRTYDGTRKGLIIKDDINVYPDTLCWIRDFAYAANEPMIRNYFWHPAFDDYPVVGVTWKQAKAFCSWRTKIWNMYKGDQPNTESFRLPTEFEWEYAARGGHDLAPYPWGGYYIRNAKGCLLANFKPGRGNYPDDGGQYTVKADAYFPNDFGLYNMSGNVSEWTETAYDPYGYSAVHDMNPTITYDAKEDDPEAFKRKVIRGGSWKDISYYLQCGTRHWEFQDTSKSYIGFRCALTYLGRSLNDY